MIIDGVEVAPPLSPEDRERVRRSKIFGAATIITTVGILGGAFYVITEHIEQDKKRGAETAIINNEFSSASQAVINAFGSNVLQNPQLFRLAERTFPHNSWLSVAQGDNSLQKGLDETDIYWRGRALESAVHHYTDSLRRKDTYAAHLSLGKALARLEHFDGARTHLESAYGKVRAARTSVLDQNIHNVANWLEYVSFCLRDGKALEQYAREALKRTEEGDALKQYTPKNQPRIELPEDHTYLGIALMWRGATEEARREFHHSLAEFEEKTPLNNHEHWVKARHLLMGHRGLMLLGEQDHFRDVDNLVGFYQDDAERGRLSLSPGDLERILTMPARL